MEPLPGSPMPPGGSLFARESLDLVFFIRSGGASEDRIEVVSRPVSFWSEGTRLSGALFHPKGLGSGEKLPAIVMSGGLAQVLDDAYAPYFAAEGFAVLTFDYRGRGRSDGRLSSEVGEAINPRDPTEDIVRAIDFLEREEIVDPARLGYWGAGDSGGHALRIAGHDARIKAVVAQAPAMDSRADPRLVKAPILILDAGEGEVREIRENGAKLYEIVKDRVPSRYHVFPGTTRDDLHGRKRAEAVGMAIEWFREHLGISPRPGDSKLR
jgi:dienelactone hydrolase